MSYRGRGRGGSRGGMQIDRENSAPSLATVNFQNWQGGLQTDLVNFIKRKCRIQLHNIQRNGDIITAQVPEHTLEALLKWNGVRFAGNALQITSGAAGSSNTESTVQLLKEFLQSRYSPQSQLLNLASMGVEPVLQQKGLLSNPTTATKMFKALLKLAQEHLPTVKSVSLESNQLSDISTVQELSLWFPNLENLSLMNNMIPNYQALLPWRNKFPKLKELVVRGNPLVNDPNSQREIVAMFPRLILLDGMQVRSEAELPPDKLPLPVAPTFFENGEVQQIAQSFLAEFLRCWDADRTQLMPLYDSSSLFSMSINTNTPKLPVGQPPHRRGPNPNIAYTANSRNLSFANNAKSRNEKLAIGPAAVLSLFQKLPASRHDLSKADDFAIDAITLTDVRNPGDHAISISIHGEMTDVPANLQRAFDRTLVIIPSPAGSGYVVVSDMLSIRGSAGSDAFKSTQNNPGTPAPTPAPSASPGPGDANVVVHQLMAQTGLSMEYAHMCLQQANFDLTTALNLFEQSRGQLPATAFAQHS